MERDARGDKGKQMTLTFQMRKSIFDIVSETEFFVNLYHSFVNKYACKCRRRIIMFIIGLFLTMKFWFAKLKHLK